MLGYGEAIAFRQKLVDDFPGVPQHRQDLALTYAQLSSSEGSDSPLLALRAG